MAAGRAWFPQRFRALRHRNFRLFLSGQVLSLVGTWMQNVAVGWLVYRLTRSSLLLGIVNFAQLFPSLLLAPVAGVLADRLDRRHMVIATQVLGMLQALLLAALVLGDAVTVPLVVALQALLGLVSGADIPARQALLVEMVEGREDLGNAIALNSSAFNAARLVGPALAGLLIAVVGEGPVFLLNALSYVAVLVALVALRLPQRAAPPPTTDSVGRRLREGLAYAWGFLPMRAVLLLVALVSLMGVPYSVLLPIFAAEVFGGGPRTLGLLGSASGLGALAGALYLAGRPSVRGLGRVIVAAVSVFGLALVAFAASPSLPSALPLLFLAGAGVMVQMAASNTILQTLVDDDKRGRVVSLYAMAFMGMVPIGGLAAGALAARLGAPATVALGGLACLAGATAFAHVLPRVREQARPVYERLGVAPETAPLRQPQADTIDDGD